MPGASDSQQAAPGRGGLDRREVSRLVRAAALSCYGVAAVVGPGWRARVAARLGRGSNGVEVEAGPELRVQVNLQLAAGVPAAQVVANVADAVRYTVQRDTGRAVAELRLTVDGITVVPAAGPGRHDRV